MTTGVTPAAFVELHRNIAGCSLCQLSRTRSRAVPGEGSPTAEVMFIGEGPGFHEDQQGRPFVGPAGKLLDRLIEVAGLRREEVYITNVVKCRPPQNRDPLPHELSSCRPYLDRQIAMIDPDVIVTLGRYSLGAFFPTDSISRVHGTVRQKDGRHYFAMYHPAAALHRDQYRQIISEDARALGEWLASRRRASDEGLQGVLAVDAPEKKPEHQKLEQLALF